MIKARGLSAMAAELGRVGGWAPGSYLGKCRSCEREFTGDKRAMECLPCATINLQERSAAMYKALHDINRLNDHPGYFNAEIQKVLKSVIDTRDTVFPVVTQSS